MSWGFGRPAVGHYSGKDDEDTEHNRGRVDPDVNVPARSSEAKEKDATEE
jgi:hypothetical protein